MFNANVLMVLLVKSSIFSGMTWVHLLHEPLNFQKKFSIFQKPTNWHSDKGKQKQFVVTNMPFKCNI